MGNIIPKKQESYKVENLLKDQESQLVLETNRSGVSLDVFRGTNEHESPAMLPGASAEEVKNYRSNSLD